MKILVATDKPFAKVAVDGIRKEIEAAGYEFALLEKYTEKAQLLDAVKDANAIIIRSDIVDAEVLDAAKELKIVVRAGAGYDNVDLAAATAHNVCVMNIQSRRSFKVSSRTGAATSLKERLDWMFETMMKDNEKGKCLNASGKYVDRESNGTKLNSQELFYAMAYSNAEKAQTKA